MDALKGRQLLSFVLAWIAYASSYFLRKPLGIIKADLQKNLSFSTSQLGWLDSALLFPYAVMQIILGPLGDRFGARKTFGVCLMLSALSMICFGNFSSFGVFFLMLFLNGTAQSQCWPNCTKGLLSWFPDSVRNSVFGMFGTCAFAGGIMGTMIAVYLQSNYGWQTVYFWPSVFVFAMGTLVFMMFTQPQELGIEIPGQSAPDKSVEAEKTNEPAQKPKLMDLWRLPMIAEVSVAVFCLKVVRYCMYMWLPMYLLQELHYTQSKAGMFSTVFEIGGVLGSALIGFVLDRYYKVNNLRGIAFFVLISTSALVTFSLTSSWGVWVNSLCMFVAGAFNAGPDILLCGTVPTELVEKHNKNAATATVGLVNGFGSIGTCIEGPIIGLITAYAGWSGMFYFMIGLSALGTLATYRAAFIHSAVNRSPTEYI